MQAYYDQLCQDLRHQFSALPAGASVRLHKPTSNLFRARAHTQHPGLDVSGFRGVLSLDPESGTVDVLGMTTYEELVAATLPYGWMPKVVPQLRTITLGGAVTGLGIESSSFRSGCPHESVLELDILTGTGQILTVTNAPDDPHADLFAGFPNSYGSLGYALRLRIELEPAARYVAVEHVRCDSVAEQARIIAEITASAPAGSNTHTYRGRQVDFLDGAIYRRGRELTPGEILPPGSHVPAEHVLTIGTKLNSLDEAASLTRTTSSYSGANRPPDPLTGGIYYRSQQRLSHDVLTLHDYLWRWDTDWFWCSRAFGTQHPLLRRFWPAPKLRSNVYWKLIALDRRWQIANRLAHWRNQPERVPVVQDVEVPVQQLETFVDAFHREIGIDSLWICPLRQRDPTRVWPLYQFDPEQTYINLGFWSTVPLAAGESAAQARADRRIEQLVQDLGGRKSLYSTAHYAPEDFWNIYGGSSYQQLRQRYDPQGRLTDLYDKVVGEQ